MNNFLTLTMLKRYALAMGGLALIGLLLFVVEKVLDTRPTSEGKVYQLPESKGADTPELGAEPPPVDPEVLAAHLKKVERLQEVEAQLMAAGTTNDRDEMLAQLELEEEMLTLNQEFGTLEVDQGDPFLYIKVGKLMLLNMTDNHQLPVSVGLELVDLLIESGKVDDAVVVYMATQQQ